MCEYTSVVWSLYAVLYFIAVTTLGLMLLRAERTVAGVLELVFLIIAVVLFRYALKDVSASLDTVMDDRERIELKIIMLLLIAAFVIAGAVLSYGFLKALFPFL